MKKIEKFNKSKGFSLTELSIVLTIIAMLMGASFSVYNGNNNAVKLKDTLSKMKIIEQALAAYVSINNRMPCVSNIDLADSNTNSGLEWCGCHNYAKNKAGALPSTPTAYSSPQTWITIGAVPYKVLNLPKEFLVDGWGHRFVYAVPKGASGDGCTYGSPSTIYSLENNNMGLITVYDPTLAVRTDSALYVLMSVGANGKGGFQETLLLGTQRQPIAQS